MNKMGVLFILHIAYLLFYFSQLTLSCLCVCVWRWSCDSLHGSRCWHRWC